MAIRLEDLTYLGFRKGDAKVIISLIDTKKPLTAREIEARTELRQPEVSLAMTNLNKLKFLITTTKNIGRGRPILLVTLRKKELYNLIKKDIKDKISTLKSIYRRVP